MFLAGIFLFIATKVFNFNQDAHWHIWLITAWLFLFILHFIKVFITDRFMDKNWEREQIDRLVGMQEKKIEELKNHLSEETPTK